MKLSDIGYTGDNGEFIAFNGVTKEMVLLAQRLEARDKERNLAQRPVPVQAPKAGKLFGGKRNVGRKSRNLGFTFKDLARAVRKQPNAVRMDARRGKVDLNNLVSVARYVMKFGK